MADAAYLTLPPYEPEIGGKYMHPKFANRKDGALWMNNDDPLVMWDGRTDFDRIALIPEVPLTPKARSDGTL